jgi:type II secretory pathway component PulK
MTSTRQKRSGIAAIVVLVATSVIMSIVANAMVATIRSNRERKIERLQIQLRFVSEAGALRTLKILEKDPTFSGEEWVLSIDPQTEQSATIQSKILEDQTGAKKIEIVAILNHPNPHQRMQLTKTYSVQPTRK